MSQFALQHGSFDTSWSLSAEDLLTIMFMRCDYDATFKCSPRHRFELFWPQKAVRNFETITGLFLIWQYYFLVN